MRSWTSCGPVAEVLRIYGAGRTDAALDTSTESTPYARSIMGELFAGRYVLVDPLGSGGMGVVARLGHPDADLLRGQGVAAA